MRTLIALLTCALVSGCASDPRRAAALVSIDQTPKSRECQAALDAAGQYDQATGTRMVVGTALAFAGPVGFAGAVAMDVVKNNERAKLGQAVEVACGTPAPSALADSRNCVEKDGRIVCA